MTYQARNYRRQGGDTWTVGGTLNVTTSGTLTVDGAAAFNKTLTIGSGGYLIDEDGKRDDLFFPASAIRVPVSSAPAPGNFIGTLQALAFDAGTRELVQIQSQMPHDWKKSTSIYPHVHYATTASTGGKVVWGLEYSIADIGGSFTSPTTAKVVVNASTLHSLGSLGEISMASYTGPSTMLMLKLYRDSTNSSDTTTTDAHLLQFDIHYLRNSLGSSGLASQGP